MSPTSVPLEDARAWLTLAETWLGDIGNSAGGARHPDRSGRAVCRPASTCRNRRRRRSPRRPVAQVIRGDNFYSINPRGRGRFDITDWRSLLGLLQTLYGSDRLRYVGRDYDGVGVAVDEPIRDVIIVEGIQLLHAEAMPLYDVAVWIDCPHDAATERAKTHNRSSGDSDYEIALWDDIWGPLDAECFREYEPMSVAAFVYRAPL